MNKLFELGINEDTIRFMLEQCNNIINMSDEEIEEKINILTYVGCNERYIKNIIVSNPYFLDRINDDVLKLISYLKEIGIKNINLLFDSNPYFLNKDVFEIEDYINDRLEKKECLEDIIEDIENNPYIIEEY